MTMASNSSSPIYAYLYPILRLNGSYSGDYTHATEALKWQQLKSISIFGSDVSSPAIKRFVFEYSDNPNVRLTLNSVAVDDYDPQNNNSGVGGKYTFEYNCVDSLPAYCSWHTDHWGYYNGKTHEDDIRSTQYYGKRNPDSVKSAFGSLSKITYPTGGYTRFVYEPNDYSFAVSEDHIGVENISGQAGGLRVKEIRNSASGSANDEYPAKRYIYKTGYSPSGQGASSGALLNRIRYQYDPYYMTNVSGSQNTMSMYHSASIIPAMDCFGGACVGYSEVTEVMTDNSYTTYKFSNIDNGALDAGADASIQNHTIFEPYSTKSQERGLLLKKTEYDSSGNRVGTSSYVYEKDDTTSNNFVRSMRINTVQGVNSAANVAIEGTAYRLYTYSMRQVAQYDTIFDGSQAFATRTITEYNPHKLVKKIVRTVGPGIDEITSLKYPMDRNDEKFPQMTAAHIFSPLVEKIVTRYDNSTSTTLNVNKQFNHYKSNMVKPSSISEALDNNGYHTADSLGYDNYFNTICHARYGVPQSRFLWSYKGLYPVAFTEGNEYPVLGSTMAVFTDSLSFNRILNASSLKSLSLCEYTPFGKVSKTTSRTGDTLYYYYDLIGRLKYSRNSDGRMLDLYNYHYSTDNSADNFNYLTKTEFITPVMHSATPNVTLSNSVTDTGFFDGLGRKLQTVSVGAATSGGDIADYTEYDATGSPVRQWLPAVGSGSSAFTPLSSLQYSGVYSGGNYSDFHTQISYENRPSHRPTEVRQAGTDWLNADGAKTYYKINTSAANGEFTAMWLRLTSSGGLEKAGTYPAGNLLVTKNVDEDGCPLLTFIDKAGNKVLERRQPDTTLPSYADTYFVYDNQGNVRYAISPEGSKLIAGYANGEINASDNAIVLYSYTYQYDHRNRLYGKKLPGIMPENFLFDNLDRVRFSNDGNHNIAGRWIATEYDRYNRVAYTADFATTKTYSQLRSSVLQTNENVALTEGAALGNGKIFGYSVTDANSQNGGNFTADDVISVNYYDDYGFLSNFATSGEELAAVKSRLDYQAMTGYGTKSASARAAYGLTTGTVRRVLWSEGLEQPSSAPLTDRYVFSASYYDSHGRLIQSRETNLLGGQENYYYDLSFTGKPLRVRHEHVTADTTITETTTYTYDNRDRLVATAHNFGNDAPTTLHSDQLDALGRVATRHLGGNSSADALTSVAYGYDLHGNVASITSDQFSQTLRRERRGDNSVGLLNGNICEQEFTLIDHATPAVTSTYSGTFSYEYDKMNRLTRSSTPSFSHRVFLRKLHRTIYDEYANRPNYSERASYDLNTNIKSFSRRGFLYDTSGGKYYGLLDSLTVYCGGNQVRLVTDAVTTDYGHPAEYRDGASTWYEHNHDKNGNLVCDLDRGVEHISYNLLNLPDSIGLADGHETFNIYDADGRKLRTVHIVAYDPVMLPSGETITPTDTLVRDYSGGHIYENGVLERTLTPTGFYSAADSEYCHYIKDYQGNNIAVVKADTNGVAEVVSATLMYPFGGELTEFHATDRYRFGGKELDARGGLFHYDFGARCYDPVLPMFNGYDRMAEKYCHLSPFAYCAGNPIRYIDPNGEDYNVEVTDNAVLIKIFVFTLDDEAFALAKQASDIVNANSYKRAVEVSTDSGQEILPVVFQSYVLRVEGSEADVSPSIAEMRAAGMGGNLFLYKDEINNNKNGNAIGDLAHVYRNHVDTSGAHEFGHLMGMIHSWSGIMTASSEDELRSDKFSAESIGQSLHIIKKYQIKINSKEHSDAVIHFINNSRFSDKQLEKAKLVDYKHRR